jgi:hypothetical protein
MPRWFPARVGAFADACQYLSAFSISGRMSGVRSAREETYWSFDVPMRTPSGQNARDERETRNAFSCHASLDPEARGFRDDPALKKRTGGPSGYFGLPSVSGLSLSSSFSSSLSVRRQSVSCTGDPYCFTDSGTAIEARSFSGLARDTSFSRRDSASFHARPSPDQTSDKKHSLS